MAKERALYYSLAASQFGTRTEVDNGTLQRVRDFKPLRADDPAFRLTSSGVAVEVWEETPISFRYPVRNDQGELILKDTTWEVQPGDALRSVWRRATAAERAWVESSRRAFLPTDFTFFGETMYAHILIHFDDLLALFRQLLYHIPDSYLGTKLRIRGRWTVVPGRLDDIKQMRELLRGARAALHQQGVPFPNRKAMVSEATVRVADRLESKGTVPLLLSAKAIERALGTDSPSVLAQSLFESDSRLAEEQLRQGEIVMRTIDNAWYVVRMIHEIETGVKAAFDGLSDLVNRITDGVHAGQLASACDSLWTRLVRVCPFDPYRAAIFSARGRGIYRAAANLRKGNFSTANNNVRQTIGAIRKLVSGEGPTPGQMTRTRKRAQRAYPGQEIEPPPPEDE
ncbi:hypothetical protein KJ713_03420 [Patescibacteria group bacterium]|nr:hypothetical protein [Patescibacteria group bacterium]